MATRRDELSAHTFARKRTLAAFLQPESRVTDEEAPRPVRAMMPSMVVGLVLVVGAVAWGAISPSAPPKWNEAGKHIIVDSDSTTRYVVLKDKVKNGKKVAQLHPVLNFASAKLVLDKNKGEVIEVSGDDIDESPIPRGSTIGIPYAPDRLPEREDAETSKEWAVCEKPGTGGKGEPQQGLFVFGGREKDKLKDKNRLANGEALYVENSKTGDRYMIDNSGVKLRLLGPTQSAQSFQNTRDLLARLALGNPQGEPQKVTPEWLKTFKSGDDLTFPELDAAAGTAVSFQGSDGLPQEARRVGMMLYAKDTESYYVVMKNGVERTSPLVAKLAMGGADIGQTKPISVSDLQATNAGAESKPATGDRGWPLDVQKAVNLRADSLGGASRSVSCSVYTGKMANGKPKLAAWAGADYPANIVEGSASAYVTSGSGLLYREFGARQAGGGGQFLLTDSGLRHSLPKGGGDEQGEESEKSPTARLGYAKPKEVWVPQSWSSLLPKGPTLDTRSAAQEQGL